VCRSDDGVKCETRKSASCAPKKLAVDKSRCVAAAQTEPAAACHKLVFLRPAMAALGSECVGWGAADAFQIARVHRAGKTRPAVHPQRAEGMRRVGSGAFFRGSGHRHAAVVQPRMAARRIPPRAEARLRSVTTALPATRPDAEAQRSSGRPPAYPPHRARWRGRGAPAAPAKILRVQETLPRRGNDAKCGCPR
jgi:hypothetical protein